jgi:transposase
MAEHLDPTAEPDQVQLGIETGRGPWVQALLAAGYVVFAINPLQVARYRERHSASGTKSDAADAHLLAEIVRLDRAHHRPVAGDVFESPTCLISASRCAATLKPLDASRALSPSQGRSLLPPPIRPAPRCSASAQGTPCSQ